MYVKSNPIALYTFELNGRNAFLEWMRSVENTGAENAVKSRIRRVRKGIVGDVKTFRLKNKPENPMLVELRINCRSGYRIYAARCPDGLVLLHGGTKRRQLDDVRHASTLCRRFASSEGTLRPLRVRDMASTTC